MPMVRPQPVTHNAPDALPASHTPAGSLWHTSCMSTRAQGPGRPSRTGPRQAITNGWVGLLASLQRVVHCSEASWPPFIEVHCSECAPAGDHDAWHGHEASLPVCRPAVLKPVMPPPYPCAALQSTTIPVCRPSVRHHARICLWHATHAQSGPHLSCGGACSLVMRGRTYFSHVRVLSRGPWC